MGQRIHFGCGMTAPVTWRNFDAGPSFWLEKTFPFTKSILIARGYPDYPRNIEYGDVIKGLPVIPGSASAVYCSHVLEHLTLEEFRATLRNVHTYLESGGTFRMVLPDIEWLIRQYLASSDPYAASTFMRESYLGLESRGTGMSSITRALFGRSAHLWMWDEKNISAELAAAGFTDIRRATFGDEPGFEDVESMHRWTNCLGMNCHRP
jgi:hypothetical protein